MGFSHDDNCAEIKKSARSLKDKVSKFGAYVCTVQGPAPEAVRLLHDDLNTLGFLKTFSVAVTGFNVDIKGESRRLCYELLAIKKRIETCSGTLKDLLTDKDFADLKEEIKGIKPILLKTTDLLFHFVLDSGPNNDVISKLFNSRHSQYKEESYSAPQYLKEKRKVRLEYLHSKLPKDETDGSSTSSKSVPAPARSGPVDKDSSMPTTSGETLMDTGLTSPEQPPPSKSSDVHAAEDVTPDPADIEQSRTGTLQLPQFWKQQAIKEAKFSLKELS